MAVVSGERWARLKKQGMIDIVNRLLVHLLPGAPGCDDAGNIEQCCPGTLCALRSTESLLVSLIAMNLSSWQAGFVDRASANSYFLHVAQLTRLKISVAATRRLAYISSDSVPIHLYESDGVPACAPRLPANIPTGSSSVL